MLDGGNAAQRHTVRVFASSAALCIEATTARKRADREPPIAVVQLEAARSADEGTYDWEHKIIVQLSPRELPLALAVLMGWRSHWSAQGHGSAHDKGIVLQTQADGVLVKMRQGAKNITVPIMAADLYAVIALALRVFHANDPHVDSETTLRMCKRVSDLSPLQQAQQGRDRHAQAVGES